MTPRDDLDGQATSGRAERRKNRPTRQAGRILARAGWLDALLVFWTGEPEDVPRLAGVFHPLRAVLQDRLAELPGGLYAVRLDFPDLPAPTAGRRDRARSTSDTGGPLRIQVAAIDAVTRERVAETARAIEAAARFPRAGARFVGPVDRWREQALARLDAHRRAVEGAEAWRAGAPGALGLEVRAFWLGAALPPSAALPESALSSWAARSGEADPAAAHLAAVELGRRHAAAACDARLSGWAASGRALDRWPAAAVAWTATAVRPESLAALAISTPALNDPLARAWVDERIIDHTRPTGEELADLARLFSAVATARDEPARRHATLVHLAVQYFQLWRGGPGQRPGLPHEVAEGFRGLVLDLVYGDVRDLVQARWHPVPDSVLDLAGRWLGEEFLGWRRFAYVDHLAAQAASALNVRDWMPTYEDPPTDLSQAAPPGSAPDPAGAIATVAVASRLRLKGAGRTYETMADWLETCRPLVPLATFWREVFAIVPSGAMRLDAARAQALGESVRSHARRLAVDLALGFGEQDAVARAALPAVLARGPDSTQRVFRHELWLPDEESLDTALRWVESAECLPGASGPDVTIPVPRQAFVVPDPAVRDALLRIGLRVWGEGGAGAKEVEALLGTLAEAASGSGGAYWRAALPRLVDVAARLASHALKLASHARQEMLADSGDWPRLVHVILDVCARWESVGFGDAPRLARILANRWRSADQAAEEWDPEDDDRDELRVRLSEGRITRFLALLRHPPAPRRCAWRALDGWALVDRHPTARAWMSACLDRPELLGRVMPLLDRLALLARLAPGLTAARFFEPLDRPPDAVEPWPSWVQPDAVPMLEQVVRASAVAEVPRAVPGVLRRLLERGATDQQELAVLRARSAGTPLARSERARLDKLERLVADPAAWAADLRAELDKTLAKQGALAGLAALESLARRDLERRWRQVLGGECPSLDSPAWDNALHMLGSIKHNRRILVRLLRHAARGDRGWTADLGPNKAFLAQVAAAGLRSEEWLGERSAVIPGSAGTLTAYATTDPLEVLQMGSLFGTCLSAGRFNAHAAVAAAVEANKRVLYVKDRAGRVLGRQLLALTAVGELIGFTAYGAAAEASETHGAWVKLALELLALAVARASGARLMPGARVSSGLDDEQERSLMLFCHGYVDSPEPFDWWIEALASADPGSGEGDRELLRSLLGGTAPASEGRPSSTGEIRERGWATCRALLWLGVDAPSLTAEQEEALGLCAVQRALLANPRR